MTGRRKPSKAASVAITERALEDLRNVETYSVKQWGRRTAEKYLDDIAAALDRLTDPDISRLETELAPGLFCYRARKHVLVYDVHDDVIILLTVIHTSMDLPARLTELQPRLIVESQYLHEKLRSRH